MPTPSTYGELVRRLAEAEAERDRLRDAERDLRRAQALSQTGSWRIDLASRTITGSEEAARIYGLDSVGWPLSAVQAAPIPEHRPHLDLALAQLIEHGAPYDVTFLIRRASDGALRDIHSVAEYDAANGVVHGTIQDITDRRQAEARIRLLSEMLDLVPAAVTVYDEQGECLFANQATAQLHGYDSTDAYRAVRLQQVNVPDSAEKIAGRMALIARDGFAHFDVQHYRQDGSVFPLEVLSRRISWEGRPALLAVATDITERRQAERELRHTHDLLARSQAIAHVGSWVRNLGETVLEWSDEAYRIFGVTPDAFDPTVAGFYAMVHPDDRAAVDQAFGDAVRDDCDEWQVEHRIVRPDGDVRTVHERCVFERGADGAPVRAVGTVQDITDQKALEAKLAQAQKMESVGRLAGGVAHDFNNMLGVILGYADLATELVPPGGPLFEYLTGIHGAARRSADMTQQLLAFARRQTIAPKVLDLNGAIDGTLRMLRRLIGEDIDLAWMPESGVPPVLMDPAQVNQILANLCVNARDAIAGVGKITIETDAVDVDDAFCASHPGFVPGRFVTLTVSDNGCGMDRETLDKLFEPFFTTKDVNKGTGLGLATVYGIVKQNRGFIDVYSEVGQGSTFRIYLPAHGGAIDETADAEPAAAPRARAGETILLVEDEPAVLKLGAMMLELLGYGVLAASSPQRALDMARACEGAIHLLVTDVVMPEMNGRELARQLDAIRPGVRKLYASGYTANVIAHHGVLDEGVDFIHKPFSMKALAAAVRRVLDA